MLATVALLCAYPVAAGASDLLGSWPMDEGSGAVAADVTGHGLGATLSAEAGGLAPTWIAGHAGGSALSFGGAGYLAVPASTLLTPARIGVDAWVRRSGSPGRWRYLVSQGAMACDRSAYALYSGFAGGLAFYVSDSRNFHLSPEAPADVVWDGAWHHVTGSFDGATVTLTVDARPVGTGTPGPATIAYGQDRSLLIGTYRGSCDLPFSGDLDDVSVWNGTPTFATATPPGPTITPVATSPTIVPVGSSGPSVPSATTGTPAAPTASTAKTCARVTVDRRTIRVRHRTRLVATVKRNRKVVARAAVVVSGKGIKRATAQTDRKGRARIVVHPARRGTLKLTVRGQKSSCTAAGVRVR
jgi:Concanavalin A-like lectin/glucanases superfamily